MTSAIESRLARLESAAAIGTGRNIVVAGGRLADIAEYLASFGVVQNPLDTVTHIDQPGEMVLVSCDDWGVMLVYVAKYGKSLIRLDEDDL
ncbi:hypothetical protein [Devosia ginsengisoli]|uniref:hypothetical protein n=1 Tax=Devosia ginsengisoli TaxID=400770 RepID=UPI0026E98182|nr:hypothetical protein [Devosia ginsengisoli]MCR6671474.1 hypothetical protein [Devosia ginsengisoli]